MNYLNSLNPKQKEAVLHTEGPLLIFAGAGSGKTRVLTYRVAHLIQQGVDPYHIIAITFTNKAAKEMKERISNIVPLGEQVWVSTFHAACTRILRREIEHVGYSSGFSIYDTQDSLRLIKDCLTELNLNEKEYPPRSLAAKISSLKNDLISPAEFEKTAAGFFRENNIAEVYSLYQKRLKAANSLDFDDIILRTVELLTHHDDIRYKYQNRFRYVMVDEYQDTNHAQYQLVSLLSGYAENLCVVGDDDQSIYGWRGANIENILNFNKDYPTAKVVKLEENYRSTQRILNAANSVIQNNEARADKKLWTQNGIGEKIRVYMATNERDEASFVVKTISQSNKYSNFAVLYRTNAQSRNIEDALVREGIPYRMFGGVRFYEHTEIKDILAYLKCIHNPADDLAFTRIINVPRRGIGNTSITRIQMFAYENNISFFDALKKAAEIPGLGRKAAAVTDFLNLILGFSKFADENSVSHLIRKIISDIGYFEIFNDGTPESQDRISNLMELIATANGFEQNSDDTSLGKFLEDVALVADIDNYEESANAVSLMTLHSSKGLEFNCVFIIGNEENIFPSIRLTESEAPQLEEERRLCYVGVTRARQILYMTHALSRIRYDTVVRNAPSRFLGEIPMENLTPVNSFGKPKHESQASKIIPPPRPMPKKGIFFNIGDRVKTAKYGEGEVTAINPAGADFELTINFNTAGKKKIMPSLLPVTKIEV